MREKLQRVLKYRSHSFLSLYVAGKVLLESDESFWGLLTPVLIFYLTSIGYYSYLELTRCLDSFLEGQEKKWSLWGYSCSRGPYSAV